MSMGNKRKTLTSFVLLSLLAACGFGVDKNIDDPARYNGCYHSKGLVLLLEDGKIKTTSGRFIYNIYQKKIGIVLASNFYLKRDADDSLKILPNNYEKFYLIRDGRIRITDSDSYVHILTKVDLSLCEGVSQGRDD